MLRSIHIATTVCALVASVGPTWGGMPVLTLGNPEASAPARSIHAVLTLKPGGCLAPDTTTITGVAAGIVGGDKQSIPLKITPLPETGLYAVTPQWPSEGKWILQLTATDGPRTITALVPVGPKGAERGKARFFTREVSAGDIDALLNSPLSAAATK
jgi:hypothetical protein